MSLSVLRLRIDCGENHNPDADIGGVQMFGSVGSSKRRQQCIDAFQAKSVFAEKGMF
jgi:hypothetical protein